MRLAGILLMLADFFLAVHVLPLAFLIESYFRPLFKMIKRSSREGTSRCTQRRPASKVGFLRDVCDVFVFGLFYRLRVLNTQTP